MNLKFNKPFLDRRSEVFDNFFQQNDVTTIEANCTIYTDAINGDTTDTVATQYILFGSQSLVDVFDKINNAFWNESFDIASLGNIVKTCLNTIISGSEPQRNSALSKLVQMGIVSESDTTMTRVLASRIPDFNPALVTKDYISDEQKYRYAYNIPIALEKKYDQVRNTSSEKLFLIFPSRVAQQYGAVPLEGTMGYVHPMRNILFEKNSMCISFAAVAMADLFSEEAAIKYDHVDVIEYLDNFILNVKLPVSGS